MTSELLDKIVTLSMQLANERSARVAAEARANTLESKTVPQPVDASEVIALIKHMALDRKIEAIKSYRALTGFGLKESKDAIETVTGRFA